jgi:hypothetical protein
VLLRKGAPDNLQSGLAIHLGCMAGEPVEAQNSMAGASVRAQGQVMELPPRVRILLSPAASRIVLLPPAPSPLQGAADRAIRAHTEDLDRQDPEIRAARAGKRERLRGSAKKKAAAAASDRFDALILHRADLPDNPGAGDLHERTIAGTDNM